MTTHYGISGGRCGLLRSIPCFTAVANGEDDNLLPIVMGEGDVGALTEFDDPLAKLGGQIFNRATDLWMPAKRFDTLPQGMDGALRGIAALRSEKGVEPGYIRKGWLGPDQMWHAGAAASSPASSFESQRSASASER